MAQLNASRDALIASGLGSVEDAKHVCASYGAVNYPSKPAARTGTGNGTTTVTIAATVWAGGISAGMVVKGTGLGTDPVVVDVPTNTTVVLSEALSAGSYSLTFCANDQGLAVTCNGTTSVTVSTTGLFVGQEMFGEFVPAGTFITVLGSGVVTVSNAVPSTCVRASFLHTSGEFAVNKLEDALIANGYKSLRRVQFIGGAYTGYGLDPLAAMQFPGLSIDGTTADATVVIANLQQGIDDCCDVLTYMHWAAAQNLTHAQAVADFIEARVAAGDVDVVSVPELFRRASLRSPFA
jgi:hypothetical protein